ncbi:MAG: hypothetical protein ACYC7E_00445 [Armatimonadota bacterium]
MSNQCRITITLDESDLLALQQILVDDDAKAALDFIKQTLAPRIPQQGWAPCDSARKNPFLLKKR